MCGKCIKKYQGLFVLYVGLFAIALMGVYMVGCSRSDDLYCDLRNPCSSGLVCIENRCEQKRCQFDEQCDFGEYCDKVTNRCKRRSNPSWDCRTDADCRIGEKCLGGWCKLASTEISTHEPSIPERDPNECSPPCQLGFICDQGRCIEDKPDVPCKLDSDCQEGRCNLLVDLCQLPCQNDAECAVGRRCSDGFCQRNSDISECNEQRPCPSPKLCHAGKCTEPECHEQKPCPAPKLCHAGKCTEPPTTCDAHHPCPTGQKCYNATCVPNDYCELDSECAADQRCTQNRCGFCQKNDDCYAFQVCEQSKCIFREKKLGESCQVSDNCAKDAYCIDDGSGQKFCRQSCDPIAADPGCAAGTACSLLSVGNLGACLPMIGSGALQPGDRCDPKAVRCEVHLQCVDGGSGISYCMQLCDLRSPKCPSKQKCESVGIDPIGVCYGSGSSGNGEGQPCTKQADCQSGMFCLGIDGKGVCTPPCDPYNPTCSAGKVCDLFINYNSRQMQAAVCGPLNYGSVQEGQVCRYEADSSNCHSNIFCFPNLQNIPTGLCARPCNPSAPRCPSGMQCIISPIMWNGANLYGCI